MIRATIVVEAPDPVVLRQQIEAAVDVIDSAEPGDFLNYDLICGDRGTIGFTMVQLPEGPAADDPQPGDDSVDGA